MYPFPRRFRKIIMMLLISVTLLIVCSNLQYNDDENCESASVLTKVLSQPEEEVQTCIHPELQMWHPDLKDYFVDVPPIVCEEEKNWIYVKDGRLRISQRAINVHGQITCDYTPYVRKMNDFYVSEGDVVHNAKDGIFLKQDYFTINCTSGKTGSQYRNIHSGIAYKPSVHERRLRLSENAFGLNVLMLGFDSMSRMTWMRNLPKSHEYFVKNMGATVLEGYNIVGDGTPAALLPILTGKTEQELPEARRGIHNARFVDGHPWIWKEFQKMGYVTQWAEDEPHVGTFQYRMMGFKNKPVDHYMRPFYIQAKKVYDQHKLYCLGSMPRHINMFNYGTEFYKMYPNKPKFSFLFHTEISHEKYSEIKAVDDDLQMFLQYMNDEGHLDNTLLILMSDHGARFHIMRKTLQGKYEERMPYVGLRFPHWFRKKYPSYVENLQKNAHKLTTPFDVHETFLDLLNFSGSRKGDKHKRGISLLKQIPADRQCSDADIAPHWCACINWQPVHLNDIIIKKAAQALVDTINDQTKDHKDKCSRLSLLNITAAVQHKQNKQLLQFKQSSDRDGYTPDLSLASGNCPLFLQVSIITQPGLASYEATLEYNPKGAKYAINKSDISRLNKYGLEPHCVMATLPHLRPYCYCLHQLPTHV